MVDRVTLAQWKAAMQKLALDYTNCEDVGEMTCPCCGRDVTELIEVPCEPSPLCVGCFNTVAAWFAAAVDLRRNHE